MTRHVWHSAEFNRFLEGCLDVHKEHDLGYWLYFNETPCYGKITIMPKHIHFDIYPTHNKDDIGNGRGCIVSNVFNRDKDLSQ